MNKQFKISISNPSAAPHVRQNILAYFESRILGTFYTSFIIHSTSTLTKFLKVIYPLKNDLIRRKFEEIPYNFIKTRPLPEIIRAVSARKLNAKFTDKIWEWSELGFDKWVSMNLIKEVPNIIHTYEHAGLSSLKMAKSLGIFKIYEQTSQHHINLEKIIKNQIEQYPKLYNPTTDLLLNDLSKKRNRRRDEELGLADLILCNSTFTKNTLKSAGINESKIRVIPLGFPKPINEIKYYNNYSPIKFLYCGNQSILKGIHLLLSAWNAFKFENNEAELYFVGKKNEDLYVDISNSSKIYNLGSLPHEDLMKKYGDFDVLILPTLGDGFGMVVTEAMSQGLPVITTTNSCGPDIIEHEKDGWIIDPGSIDSIKSTIQNIIENKENLNKFKLAALEKAKKWQWEDYRKSLSKLVKSEWKKFQEKESV